MIVPILQEEIERWEGQVTCDLSQGTQLLYGRAWIGTHVVFSYAHVFICAMLLLVMTVLVSLHVDTFPSLMG